MQSETTTPLKQSFFISGLDSTISERDIKELVKFTVGGDPTVRLHRYQLSNLEKNLAEVTTNVEECVLALHKLNNAKIKSCILKLLPQVCMKSIVISKLPAVISEKDLFLILSTLTPVGLKRVIIIDDPEISG